MTTRSLLLVCSAILTLAFPGPGVGQDLEATRSGPYLGVGLGGAIPQFDGEHFFGRQENEASINNENSLAVNARVGWRLLPFLAAEIQYEWTEEFRMRTSGSTCAKANSQVVTGNLKLIAPLETVQPYVLAGVGAGHYDLDINNIAFSNVESCSPQNGYSSSQTEWELTARFGVGMDFYLTRGIVMNFEAATLHSDDEFLGEPWPYVSLSAGIQYRF